jgi:amino acid transporter
MTQSGSWAQLAVLALMALMALTFIGIPAIGPAHYSVAAIAPASPPNGQLTDITNAMIYSITAFAGDEAAAALGEEARKRRAAARWGRQ